MIYNDFKELTLSRLGFGAMRLPLLADGSIDSDQVDEMVAYALEHGVNYFDTAYPYHGGQSEVVLGRALAKHPRDTWYLADKYPGHQIASSYDPAGTFQDQLDKCGVDYFDFYLLHNINESSLANYMNPDLGFLDYFVEQKKAGRIRHLGFSCHAYPEGLEKFLDYAGDRIEFCQIQLNYLDWTMQRAQMKYEMLTSRGIPVWVMEPVRGGRLANLPEDCEKALKALRPDESSAAWALRWIQKLPNVKMILSGMSSIDQMRDNVATFSGGEPQTDEESALLAEIAEKMKNALPCTRCRYCCDGCPKGLDIPMLIHAYNDLKFTGNNINIGMQFDAVPADKMPSECIACGACAAACPQNIDIPTALAELTVLLEKNPKWADICREREEAARKRKESRQ